MGSFSEEEYSFFDAWEGVASVSDDTKSDDSVTLDSKSGSNDSFASSLHHDVWVKSPRSVRERRDRFFSWMGVGLDQNDNGNPVDRLYVEGRLDRVREDSGAVLRKSGFEDEFCSTRSMMSCWSSDNSSSLEGFVCRDGSPGGAVMSFLDETLHEGSSSGDSELSLEISGTTDTSESTSSPSFQLMQEKLGSPTSAPRSFKKWLSRISSIACAVDKQREAEKLRNDDDDALPYRVKVHQNGTKVKELSALYLSQDIQAHEGAILTMKFSPDGRYLASAGMDKIVRVWQVLEDERSNELDIPEIDPSCIYFTFSHLSLLKPLFLDKDKIAKVRSLRKTSDSACVIFPPKVFKISEKPLHEFHGHSREILDLSWSNDNHLLSASVDKTVRLWRVGCNHSLRVFSHYNYVTCIQFNPVDNNYFISGSIDGKVRIWAIASCHVVDWIEVKDIVTAVCYRPDGQGGIVGSMEGNCRFYSMSDGHLQLDGQICLNTKKKKLPCKKITGFQFCPEDLTKVIVTCADSQIIVLRGHNVVSKYKGVRTAANQTSASFTSDGRHIISASEDSNVYLWSCVDPLETSPPQVKSIRSCERFCTNASIAIPWSGLRHEDLESCWGFHVSNGNAPEVVPFYSPGTFSLGQDYFLESFPKGSATWPEEKLLTSSPLKMLSSMHKSDYKFFKALCQNTFTTHAWGMVIVTAGSDGRIRSFPNYGLPISI